jgi:stage II sporulation protein D
MRYQGNLVLAYFHANSGGITEDAAQVWSVEIPYLKAVRDDYSLEAPGCTWKKTFDTPGHSDDPEAKRSGDRPIEQIIPERMSPTGRIMKIRIAHGDGDSVMSGNDFRLKISPTWIRSTFMSLSQNGRGKSRSKGKDTATG